MAERPRIGDRVEHAIESHADLGHEISREERAAVKPPRRLLRTVVWLAITGVSLYLVAPSVLETLGSWDALREITSAVGGARVAFSLDLRDGELMSCGDIAREPAHVAASRAVTAGVGSLIVIDVARVGTGVGLDLELIRRIRRESPVTELLAGGGIRNLDDMRGLADVGCDGVLIATALQRGALTAADVAVARTLFKPV